MFSFGGSELLIVAIIVVLLFGPDKLPQLARTIGRYTREFNKYKDIMESTLRAELYKAETESGSGEPETPVEDRISQAAAAGTELRDQMAASAAVSRETGDADPVAAVPFAVTDEADEEEED